MGMTGSRFLRRAAFLLLAFLSLSASAAERSAVHGVVPPAWIERDGRIVALRAGSVLLEGDELRTGPDGRVELDLPEGSALRLGAEVRLAMPRARLVRAAEGELFDTALHLIKGALRFTTRAVGKGMRRDVRIKVGVVTIGVRGTDLMAMVGEHDDRIMLIEGRIELSSETMAAPMRMERPMDMMSFSKQGLMSQPAMAADAMMAEMQAMETMTGMAEGSGMLMMAMAPQWDVVVMSFRDPVSAARAAATLAERGWPVEVIPGEAFGATWQRLAVRGFPTKAEALGFARRVEGEGGISGAWLLRR